MWPRKAEARLPHRPRHARRRHPLTNRAPRAVVIVERAGDDVERDAGAREDARQFRDGTDGAVRQPLRRVGMFVIERGDGLEVEDEHRRMLPLHDGQDLRRRRIRADGTDEQVEAFPREPLARFPPGFRRVHQPGGNALRAEFGQVCLDIPQIARQPLPQPPETAASMRPAQSQSAPTRAANRCFRS